MLQCHRRRAAKRLMVDDTELEDMDVNDGIDVDALQAKAEDQRARATIDPTANLVNSIETPLGGSPPPPHPWQSGHLYLGTSDIQSSWQLSKA